MLLKEVGKRLLEYANSLGEEFDIETALKPLRTATGKY